jgi:hypothetical protein
MWGLKPTDKIFFCTGLVFERYVYSSLEEPVDADRYIFANPSLL